MAPLLRIFFCIFVACLCLYHYVDEQNRLTALRLEIPPLAKEVKKIQEDNSRMDYVIRRFESPIHLMELARKPEYSHLKHPFLKDIVILPEENELITEQR